MIIYGAVGFFIFGTIIGSFLNVVILRFNTGMSLGGLPANRLTCLFVPRSGRRAAHPPASSREASRAGGVWQAGRSGCFSCGKKIKWHDLIPVVSFLRLGGRCRSCKSRLSLQYPTVELLTGLLFLATFLKYFSADFAPEFSIFNFQFSTDLVVLCLLVVIAVYDLRHKIIPDSLVFLFGALAFVRLLFGVELSSLFQFPYLLDLLSGPILAIPIAFLWWISGGRWIGLGDAKLALGIGWFLGFTLGVSAMVVGFWVGAVVGIFLVCVSKLSRAPSVRRLLLNLGAKHLTMKSEIPLAPFLILGLVIVYFSGFNVMNLGVVGI